MRKVSKVLIVLLLTIFLAFIVVVVVRHQAGPSLPVSMSTATPEKHFVVDIPQKALFKNYVTVSVEAAAGTSCELTYIAPSGDTSVVDAIAKENGICSWRWKIDEAQGRGMGRLIFTIEGMSETHFIEILPGF